MKQERVSKAFVSFRKRFGTYILINEHEIKLAARFCQCPDVRVAVHKGISSQSVHHISWAL